MEIQLHTSIQICIFLHRNIIKKIWTCDEHNMEFYAYEATILNEAKPMSLLLQKICETHIAQWSIFALFCVKS